MDTKHTLHTLHTMAVQAMERAYVPYSHFPVGVAIVTEKHHFAGGCNVENASYPLCICAEANAITNMVAQHGKQLITALLLCGIQADIMPCGGCRQIMHEFMPSESIVYIANQNRIIRQYTFKDIFPVAFSLKN